MKVSKLITFLQDIKESHGDVTVYYYDPEYLCRYPLDSISYDDYIDDQLKLDKNFRPNRENTKRIVIKPQI